MLLDFIVPQLLNERYLLRSMVLVKLLPVVSHHLIYLHKVCIFFCKYWSIRLFSNVFIWFVWVCFFVLSVQLKWTVKLKYLVPSLAYILSRRWNMSDNDWKDLVSVLSIKNQHLPGAAVEGTAYSRKFPNINSECCYRPTCISSTPFLFFFHLHIGTNSPKSSELMNSVLRNSKILRLSHGFSGFQRFFPLPCSLCSWVAAHRMPKPSLFFCSFPSPNPCWWAWPLTTFSADWLERLPLADILLHLPVK